MAKQHNEDNEKRRAGRGATGGVGGLLEQIGKTYLNLQTLETRKSDSLDFHQLAVWEVKKALQAAYDAGRRSVRPRRRSRPEDPSVN